MGAQGWIPTLAFVHAGARAHSPLKDKANEQFSVHILSPQGSIFGRLKMTKAVVACLFLLAATATISDARFYSRQSCINYMRIRYPNCRDGDICRYSYLGRFVYQRRVSTSRCPGGFAGEFNRTMSGFINNCTTVSKIEIKYICEPNLEDKAALLVESLSLGTNTEESTTTAPTQQTRPYFPFYPYFRRLYYRGKRSYYSYFWHYKKATLSTENTCPADTTSQADNNICLDAMCRKNATEQDPPASPMPLSANTTVERFDREEFVKQATSTRQYRCCGSTGADRYVLFVLDNSKAVSEGEFTAATNFVCSLTKQLCGNVKVGAITYDDVINLEFCFNCSSDRNDICDSVSRIKYRGGAQTSTASAATCVVDEVLSPQCGFPQFSRQKRHVDVIFITSGENNGACSHDLTGVMNYCQRRGYATHVLSSGPASNTAFQLTYSGLQNFTNVVFMEDLTELLELSTAIDDVLAETNADGDFVKTCTRDSASCPRPRPYYYG